MNFKDFYASVSSGVGDSAISFYTYVVNYFDKNRDQTSITLVESDSFSNKDIINCFQGFSVAFGTALANVTKYIAFVSTEDPLEDLRVFTSKYLPKGVMPTHVFVESEDKNEIERCYKLLKEAYPDLEFTQSTYSYDFDSIRREEMLKYLKTEDNIFPVESYCESLAEAYGEHSPEFFTKFAEVVDKLEQDAGARCLVYEGDTKTIAYTRVYPLILSELYIRNAKCRFWFNPDESINKMLSLSSCLFNPDIMLVEDVVDFLTNLPKLVCLRKGVSLVFHMVRSYTLLLGLTYVPLRDLNAEVQNYVFNVKDINILPINSYFDLETDDLSLNIDNELKCREFIQKLYGVFDIPNSESLNLTNLVIFIKDGVEYVGYCRKIDFTAACFSYMNGQSLSATTLRFDDIRSLIYLDFVLNKSALINSVNKALKHTGLNLRSVIPKRVMRKYSNLFLSYKVSKEHKYLSYIGSSPWDKVPNALFLSGMCSFMSARSRVSAYSLFSEDLGISKMRKMLDSFGGFNLVTNPTLKVSIFENDNI